MRLAEMVHLRQGRRIYDPPTAERFDAAIYGPLYYLPGARLVDLQQPSLLPFRLISLIGTLGCICTTLKPEGFVSLRPFTKTGETVPFAPSTKAA
jgi:hypothetical protein